MMVGHHNHDHGAACGHDHGQMSEDAGMKYKLALCFAVAANLTMFVVEIIAGGAAKSLSLWGDAMDFGNDAVTYGASLWVLDKTLKFRARMAQVKALSMGAVGVILLVMAVMRAMSGEVPVHEVMGIVGAFALLANVATAVVLYAFREGDSNMRSVWLCTRNDAIGNVLVMVAAGAVYVTNTIWPDLIVACLMAAMALHSAYEVLVLANKEVRHKH